MPLQAMHSTACFRDIMFSPGLIVLLSVLISVCSAGNSVPVQKWNSLQDGQVRYTDAAVGHQMTADGLSSLVWYLLFFIRRSSLYFLKIDRKWFAVLAICN